MALMTAILEGTIHVDPACRGENFQDLIFGADDQDVDHVAGIALGIGDAARDFVEERGGDGWDRGFGRDRLRRLLRRCLVLDLLPQSLTWKLPLAPSASFKL